MKVTTIDKKDLAAGLGRLESAYQLFGPVRNKEFHEFRALSPGQLPDLSAPGTRLSPKAVVYPQSELMFTFSVDQNVPDHHQLKEAAKNYAPRAVLGIRPCDAAGFEVVKRNFDNPEYPDPYWVRAYDATTFVGLACSDPQATCFCTSVGSGPFDTAGLDVLLVEAGDAYLAQILTEKGQALMETAGWTAAADPAEADAELAKRRQAAEDGIRSSVETGGLRAQDTVALFNAPFWEEVAFACINCGTCTYVCPTCWCFDIQDEVHDKAGVRMRNWDSCMFPLFTLHGSGHNPRDQKSQRVRQRFMHKFKYYLDKYDSGVACVGCGRCVRSCPVNIDIRRVASLMNSFDPETCHCPA